ncbi:hypothetical protein IAQ61_003548 [Plenodomus lingam]|uniref:Uncharacterized protein n=1 Tax=Leptosphaeria maculans (strain JN3 / isolate v23.1.3 / race Av1-4-5-6-7-8) TaxID=985895 RepID=E4ZQZ4_LEPMJ|nr:hypothetical protein LEMA_P033330.1 [Plenodomus lingam JN3]KAH9874359.1 hypothetical protein IAQ61_003548 [Plenodomus lingam]CBX93659.1 hypothetical protein LEMA_P033330.1 [Plenodomus lingam JN3]
MYTSTFANLFVLLSVFQFVAAAPETHYPAAKLEVRQVSATPSQADLCLDYERTANMSTIGANSSYRTILLQKSNVGTISNARMMDAAIKKLPALAADQTLNTVCGNWTEIALREAEANFTQGIVAQFTTDGMKFETKSGAIVISVVGLVAAVLCATWIIPE